MHISSSNERYQVISYICFDEPGILDTLVMVRTQEDRKE